MSYYKGSLSRILPQAYAARYIKKLTQEGPNFEVPHVPMSF